MLNAQTRMKFQADRKRSELQFQPGEQVLLKLQSYVQTSVANRSYPKLAFKYYGPYTVLKRVELPKVRDLSAVDTVTTQKKKEKKIKIPRRAHLSVSPSPPPLFCAERAARTRHRRRRPSSRDAPRAGHLRQPCRACPPPALILYDDDVALFSTASPFKP